jgi:hypothetical protein
MVRRYSNLRQEGAADDTRHAVAGTQDGDPLEPVVRGHALDFGLGAATEIDSLDVRWR